MKFLMIKIIILLLMIWPIGYYLIGASLNENMYKKIQYDLLWQIVLLPFLTAPYVIILIGNVLSKNNALFSLASSVMVSVLFFIYIKYNLIPFKGTGTFTILVLSLWIMAIIIIVNFFHKISPRQNK